MRHMIILQTQDGEWEGIFVDGRLIDEAHSLGEGDTDKYWVRFEKKFNINSSRSIIRKELNNKDDEYVCEYGSFPSTLSELKGKY